MNNNTKKTIMLGALLLGCGVTSLLGNVLGSNNKVNFVDNRQKVLQKEDSKYAKQSGFYGKKSEKQQEMMKIYVSGAVLQPGIYDIPFGSRADDAVKAAGGMTEQADPQRVNLAQKLKDGMQVNVPYAKGSRSYGKKQSVSPKREIQSYDANKTANAQQTELGELVNLNTATANELEALPGIGPSMAQRIMEYRQQKRFSRIEDLVKVPGIGKAKLNRLKGRICV